MLGPKNATLFFDWNLKIISLYLKSAPLHLSNCKISWKNKSAQIWDLKCFIWVFLGWNFQKLLSYLKLAPSDLYNIKVCWEPKMPYLGIFRLKFENDIVIFESIYLVTKIREKKVLKFGIKNALFGLYWIRILKSYYHFRNQHRRICQNWVFNSCS